ncbi:MAG: hypothetical protein DRP87_17870 [Spirochaetes bacterium]|nr:MAG: hypothetical protein DRP87_17870 [Spirochaetota bacterium]
MRHLTTPRFWKAYNNLPPVIKETADKNFQLLKQNPSHPSLHFKKVGSYWAARIGRSYRALAVEYKENVLWFWIGNHTDYERLINR